MAKVCPSPNCISAGLNYPDRADRCPACGEELVVRYSPSQGMPIAKFGVIFWVIVMVALIICFIYAAAGEEELGTRAGYIALAALTGIGIACYIGIARLKLRSRSGFNGTLFPPGHLGDSGGDILDGEEGVDIGGAGCGGGCGGGGCSGG